MLKKERKESLLFILLLVAILGSSSYAKSVGSFKIDEMISSVIGKTNFELEKKDTTVKVTLNTYRLSDDAKTTAQKYMTSLHKKSALFPSFIDVGKADGKQKKVNYGTLKKGTYRIDFCVKDQQSAGLVSWYMKGSGTINQ